MAVAVVSLGVTPLATAMLGLTVPLYRMSAVELVDRPTDQCVVVSDPPVACGKVMSVVGWTDDPLTVNPVEVLSSVARA